MKKRISRRCFLKEIRLASGAACIVIPIGAGFLSAAQTASPQVGAIVLLGPPGAGKSEQGRRLNERHSIPVISAGNLLRDHVRRGTKLGAEASTYMNAGRLVPDSLMTPILEERLTQADCAHGFILDGYPRSLAQAETLDALLKQKVLTTHILLLNVSDERVLKVLVGRRVCPRCNRSYNIHYQPPQKEGVCDADGTALTQRPDDQEAIILHRLETYHKETQPAIDYYLRQGRLVNINGEGTPESVAAEIDTKLALP